MKLLIDDEYCEVNVLSFLKCYIISQGLLFILLFAFFFAVGLLSLIVEGLA